MSASRVLVIKARNPCISCACSLPAVDKDTSGGLEFPEFLDLCKALCGTKKHWKKSIPLRVIVAVGLKLAALPAAGYLIRKAITAIPGVNKKYVPGGITVLAAEKAYKLAGGGII